MTEVASQHQPAVGVLCITCGYNLGGLDASGKCPECGTEIQFSIRGDKLAFADPAWLRRIRRGQALLSYGTLVLLVALILSLVLPIPLTFVSQSGLGGWVMVVMFSVALYGSFAVAILAVISVVVGSFLATTQ